MIGGAHSLRHGSLQIGLVQCRHLLIGGSAAAHVARLGTMRGRMSSKGVAVSSGERRGQSAMWVADHFTGRTRSQARISARSSAGRPAKRVPRDGGLALGGQEGDRANSISCSFCLDLGFVCVLVLCWSGLHTAILAPARCSARAVCLFCWACWRSRYWLGWSWFACNF